VPNRLATAFIDVATDQLRSRLPAVPGGRSPKMRRQ
jgi:hypothetical protein